MSVSKRTRYEVLRRDNHACRYCGAAAPDVRITVDHVVPVSLGGNDDPSNLVAACVDCNAGKASSNPDATMVGDVAQDALRWSLAMQQAADEFSERREFLEVSIDTIGDSWDNWTSGGVSIPRPSSWRASVEMWLTAGLPEAELLNLIAVAMHSKASIAEKWRYYCGCCWRRLTEMQERAKEILKGGRDNREPVQDAEGVLYSFAVIITVIIGQLTLERSLTPMEFDVRDRAQAVLDWLRDEHRDADREWLNAMRDLFDQESAVGWPGAGRWCR